MDPGAGRFGVAALYITQYAPQRIRRGLVNPVDLMAAVPQDATPGDHAGGIVASVTKTTTSADGKSVTIDQRVGSRVYLRVNGPTSPAVQVRQRHHRDQGAGIHSPGEAGGY